MSKKLSSVSYHDAKKKCPNCKSEFDIVQSANAVYVNKLKALLASGEDDV
jgi:Zn finger protein HypA/HybF involved in hydrogenase expression